MEEKGFEKERHGDEGFRVWDADAIEADERFQQDENKHKPEKGTWEILRRLNERSKD